MLVTAHIDLVATGAAVRGELLARHARQVLRQAGLGNHPDGEALVRGEVGALLATAHRLRTLVQADPTHPLAAVVCLGDAWPPAPHASQAALRGCA